jgi:hypothetical protein
VDLRSRKWQNIWNVLQIDHVSDLVPGVRVVHEIGVVLALRPVVRTVLVQEAVE